MQNKSAFNFDLINKDNFVSLKLGENIVYFGEIRLRFLPRPTPIESTEDSRMSANKSKKLKKRAKNTETEDPLQVRDIYAEYKDFAGDVFDLEHLKEEADLEKILSHPLIEIIREGFGTMIQYQINDDVLSKYEGQWKGGEMTGSGRVVYPNQGNYNGLFVNGRRQGFGMFEWPSGEKYSGQWVDDCMQGFGVFLTKGRR